MSTALLGEHTCTRATLQLPAWGLAWADVELAEPTALSGTHTLKLAGASYVMTVVSGGISDSARAAYRLVAGHGGWGKSIAKKSYANDAGVSKATVLRDAATACGEQMGIMPSGKLGPHFARAEDTANKVLQLIAPEAWYIDTAGITQCGARPDSNYTGDGVRVRVDQAVGVVELAVDEIGNLAPGVVVDGRPPATDVEISVDSKRITVRVYSGTPNTEMLTAWKQIFEALFPTLRYRGVFEYRVVTQSGDRLNLQPVRVASGMPDLGRVPYRPGIPGVKAQVLPGELVLVAFADADPSRPQVIAHDAPDAPGWMPLTLELGQAPTLGIARQTDAVIAGPFAGTIVGGSVRIKSGL